MAVRAVFLQVDSAVLLAGESLEVCHVHAGAVLTGMVDLAADRHVLAVLQDPPGDMSPKLPIRHGETAVASAGVLGALPLLAGTRVSELAKQIAQDLAVPGVITCSETRVEVLSATP